MSIVAEVPVLPIGRTILVARQKVKLSQRGLADKMGVPRTYISKVENGKAFPSLTSLLRFALALEIPASRLLKHAEKTAGLWDKKEGENVEG